jgi:hypothetical protein
MDRVYELVEFIKVTDFLFYKNVKRIISNKSSKRNWVKCRYYLGCALMGEGYDWIPYLNESIPEGIGHLLSMGDYIRQETIETELQGNLDKLGGGLGFMSSMIYFGNYIFNNK